MMENPILKKRQEIQNRIQKSFDSGIHINEDQIEKAKSGVYADNAQNRKLDRVGQKYGSEKKEDNSSGSKQNSKQEGDSKGRGNKSVEEHARSASDEQLQNAAKSGNEELRVAAKKELKRRETEHEDSSATKDKDLQRKWGKYLKKFTDGGDDESDEISNDIAIMLKNEGRENIFKKKGYDSFQEMMDYGEISDEQWMKLAKKLPSKVKSKYLDNYS